MEHTHLVYRAQIQPVKPLNDELTLAKCRVMALGKNRNFSHFSREAVDDALPTLANIPIVGHVFEDEDGNFRLGGHDAEIVEENGEYKFRSVCVPWGCVPESHNAHYETVVEDDGTEATYLCAYIILWNRFEDLFKAFYSDEVYSNQSMEIGVEKYAPLAEDKNYTDITKFQFSALCLLNKGEGEDDPANVTPCFPSADVRPYRFECDDAFYALTDQFKAALSLCFALNDHKEGGVERMSNEVFETILQEFGVTAEEISFDYAEMTEEEFRAALEAQMAALKEPAEPVADEPNPVEAFALTYRERLTALQNAFPDVETRDETGRVVGIESFWVMDFDDTHVFVERHAYSDAGEESGYLRVEYAMTEDGTVALGEREEVFMTLLTAEEVAAVEADRRAYEELRDQVAERDRLDREARFDEVVSEFDDVAQTAEFAEVFERRYDFETEDALRKELFAIRGQYAAASKPKATRTSTKVPIGEGSPATGGDTNEEAFFRKYAKSK